MEGSCCNEHDFFRRYHTVSGLHCRSFNNGKKVTLNALTADIRRLPAFTAAANFVDFVDEDYACFFGKEDRFLVDCVFIQQRLYFGIHQRFSCVRDGQLSRRILLWHHSVQHALQIHVHVFGSHVRKHLNRRLFILD